MKTVLYRPMRIIAAPCRRALALVPHAFGSPASLGPLRLLALGLASFLTLALPAAENPTGTAPAHPAERTASSPLEPNGTAKADAKPTVDPLQDLITFSAKYRAIEPLPPGPYDGNVASVTAKLLKRFQYYRRGMDEEIAGRFLERYLDLIDPTRIHLLASDVAEFEASRERLPDLTVNRGDTSLANQIFARFLQRVDQRVELVAARLREGQFEFTGEDRYTPNRKDAERPKDLAAAHALWHQHLRYEYLQEKLNKQKPGEIIKTLSNRYKRLLRSWGELDSDEVLQLYLTSLAAAYDPHSDYMGKAQLDNFAISMKLSLFGIGALLRSEDGYCKIESLVPGGPAARSKKVKPNDRIIAVAQKGQEPVDVVDMKLTKVVEMIRGPKNTEVTLTMIPADAADPSERKLVTLTRDEIKLEDQEAKAKIVEMPDAAGQLVRVGVIDLPSFYASFDLGGSRQIQLARAEGKADPKSTTSDVTRLLKKLTAEGVQGVVLDLRKNGGGSLEEAIRLTGLFIPEGPIVQVKDANGDITIESDPDEGITYKGPLVVLTSRFSASASEILAAALQDYGRALIVGDLSTHGKGTVQTIYELGRWARFPESFNPGALKVTIRKFYRANGWSTQLKGVTPDIILPSVANVMEVGEASQEYAMPWDTIPSAMFEKQDRVQPHLPELRRRTEARQEKDPDWAYVREDIERYRKLQADKSVALNEDQRRQEKDELEAKAKARKEERKARTAPLGQTYEINLRNALEPGLPAPVTVTNTPTSTVSTNPDDATRSGPETDSTATAATSVDDETDDTEEETGPVVDAQLDEAKRILMDLLTLAAKPGAPTPITVRK